MSDGTFAIVDNGVYLTVDINGLKNGPNKFGYDFFMFQIVGGVLKPMGAVGTTETFRVCSETSSSSYNGRGCTVKAVNEKDYFKNLP